MISQEYRTDARRKAMRSLTGHSIVLGPEASVMLGISTKHMRDLEAKGQFPARVVLGPNKVGWKLADLEAWVDARIKRHSPSPANGRGQYAPAQAEGEE